MLSKRLPELGVHQIGQGRVVGFVTDMPGLQPRQLGIRGARARFGHLGQAKVDAIGQKSCHQQGFVFGQVTRFEMGEVVGESRPTIHLHQQLGNFDVRQQGRRSVDQRLGFIGYCCIQWRDFQAGGRGDDGVRQLVGQGHEVGFGQL
jgi:hypothetical protein